MRGVKEKERGNEMKDVGNGVTTDSLLDDFDIDFDEDEGTEQSDIETRADETETGEQTESDRDEEEPDTDEGDEILDFGETGAEDETEDDILDFGETGAEDETEDDILDFGETGAEDETEDDILDFGDTNEETESKETESSGTESLDFKEERETAESEMAVGIEDNETESEDFDNGADETSEVAESESPETSEPEQEQPEPTGKQSKAEKGSKKKGKKASSDEPEQVEKPDLVLYIIIDKPINGMLSFFRSYGANVSRIFSRLDNLVDEDGGVVEEGAKDTILMQVDPTRIVFIDTGTGRFTNMGSRKALVDLIGVSDNDTKVSIFYTDSVIESEISSNISIDLKRIDWHKYISTTDVLYHILKKAEKENYVLDMEDVDDYDKDKVSLAVRGFRVRTEEPVDLGLPAISAMDIEIHREDTGHEIGGYAVKY